MEKAPVLETRAEVLLLAGLLTFITLDKSFKLPGLGCDLIKWKRWPKLIIPKDPKKNSKGHLRGMVLCPLRETKLFSA